MCFYSFFDFLLRDLRIYFPVFSGIGKNSRVLDVCSASGSQVFRYAKAGAFAVGIDLDPGMIDFAKNKKEKEKAVLADFILADSRQLPFKDASFDFVSASLALHQMNQDDIDLTLDEMKRVAKDGGFLALADYKFPLPANAWGLLVKYLERLAGREHHSNFKNYLFSGGLPEALKRNKIRTVKSEDFKSGTLTLVLAKK